MRKALKLIKGKELADLGCSLNRTELARRGLKVW